MATLGAKTSCVSMAATMLLLGILMATLEITGAQSIGVCNGRVGTNLPSPQDVVALYKSRNIGRMRIYDPDQATLEALRNSNIEVMLGVPNDVLPSLANNADAAYAWVQRNVRNYWPSVKFRYIAVGNEVTPFNGDAKYVPFVLPAMSKIFDAIASAGLQQQIKVSHATYNAIVDPSYPPSGGDFRGDTKSFINPIINFLRNVGSPILVNVYPYFSVKDNPSIKLPYALFTNPGPEFNDKGLNYQNLFDAIVDATYSALEKNGGGGLNIVVSESGWPSAGGPFASIDNARTYNQNLINHVKSGTPRMAGKALETYIFAMFNENQKNPEYEKNFGLFLPNRQPAYPINFS